MFHPLSSSRLRVFAVNILTMAPKFVRQTVRDMYGYTPGAQPGVGDRVVKLLIRLFGIDALDNEAARRECVLFGGGDEALYERAELFGLRHCRDDPLLQHQRSGERSQKRHALSALSSQCSI